MKNILIADDDKTFLLSLMTSLKVYSGDFILWKAENGRIAMELLKGSKTDLSATDFPTRVTDDF